MLFLYDAGWENGAVEEKKNQPEDMQTGDEGISLCLRVSGSVMEERIPFFPQNYTLHWCIDD